MLFAQEAAPLIENPVIQYGFAGFSMVLIGIVVWMVRNLIAAYNGSQEILLQATKVMSEVSASLHAVREEQGEIKSLVIAVKDELYRRPCLAQGKT